MEQLLSHLWGDYILQSNWMAKNKEHNSFACFVHCFVYTFCFWLFVQCTYWCLPAVFLSHFIIDRFGLGKNFKSFDTCPEHVKWTLKVIIDNTFHLTCNFLAVKLINN